MDQLQTLDQPRQKQAGMPVTVILGAAAIIALGINDIVVSTMVSNVGVSVPVVMLLNIGLAVATLRGRLIPYYLLVSIVGLSTLIQIVLDGGEYFPTISLIVFVLLCSGFGRFQRYCAAKRENVLSCHSGQ